jgi:hypothetical protein
VRNHVHFSSPAHFNDPWDCSPLYSAAGLEDESCRDRWTRFFSPLTDTLPELSRRVVEERLLLRDPAFLGRTMENLNRHSREITLQRWRIYCLTPHPDSLLMWAHYADRHRGICLQFDTSVPCIGGAFEVIYQKDRPVIDCHTLANATAMAEKMVLVKSGDWSYEQEYRILGRAGEFDQQPAQSIPKTTGDFLDLPRGALTGVIAGCKADIDLVRKIVRDCRPSLQIYRAVQSDHDVPREHRTRYFLALPVAAAPEGLTVGCVLRQWNHDANGVMRPLRHGGQTARQPLPAEERLSAAAGIKQRQ